MTAGRKTSNHSNFSSSIIQSPVIPKALQTLTRADKMASKKTIAEAVKNMPELKGLTFPLSEDKLEELIAVIKAKTDLPCPMRNEPPRLSMSSSPVSRHLAIQAYIEAYEYNFTGENFFNVKGVRQNQSLFRVLEVAKRVIRESLPIKCVEAVYLGIYCTQSMSDIERLPIIFNSEISGHRYGHIVLAVRYGGKIGAIGLSRRADLMFKAWGFDTLSDLILNYKESYQKWSHKLNKIKIGTLIPHEGCNRVNDIVEWANTVISCKSMTWEEVNEAIHKKARQLGWEPKEVSKPSLKTRSKAGSAAASSPKKDGKGAGGGSETEKVGKTTDEAEMDADLDEDKDGEQNARPSYLGV